MRCTYLLIQQLLFNAGDILNDHGLVANRWLLAHGAITANELVVRHPLVTIPPVTRSLSLLVSGGHTLRILSVHLRTSCLTLCRLGQDRRPLITMD